MPKLAPAAMVARSALFTYLTPRLAQDAKIDLNGVVNGVTSKNYNAKKPAMVAAVKKATNGKLAEDADIMDLANLLDALSPSAGQADAEAMVGPQSGGPPPMQTAPNSGAPPMAHQEGQDDEKSDIVAKIKAYLQEEGVPPEILQNLDAFLAEEGNPKPDVGDPSAAPGGPPPPDGGGPPGGGGPPNGGSGSPPEESNGGPKMKSGDQDIPPPTGLDENTLEDCVEDEDELDEFGNPKKKAAEDEVVPSEQDEPITKTAMDAAIRSAVTRAQQQAVQNQRNIRAAERYVRPWIGDMAMDSATPADVYRTALKALGLPASKVDKYHQDALVPILDNMPRPGARKPGQAARPSMAADAKIEGGSFLERFPMTKDITVQ